jgi:hypothetical protein
MNENIADLRALLFETLRALSDKVKPMEIERAYAISSIAQVIVNSAKVEVDHQRMSGRGWSAVEIIGDKLVRMGVKNGQGFIDIDRRKMYPVEIGRWRGITIKTSRSET